MYARTVSMKLKPNKSADFTKRLEADVIPVLEKQPGFQSEIAFATPDGKKAFGISLWDRKESADAYGRTGYPQVKKMLESVCDGDARVEGFEVSASTLHTTPAAAKTSK